MKAKPGRQAEADKKHETIKNSCKLGMVYPSPPIAKTKQKATKTGRTPDSILKVKNTKMWLVPIDEAHMWVNIAPDDGYPPLKL